jgi:hypothetical protein
MSLPLNPAQRLQSERLKFPGLQPDETLLLRNWLVIHEAEYDAFDYNARIGVGDDPGPAYADYARQNAVLNSQLRIDAVAWKFGGSDQFLRLVPPPAGIYASMSSAQATIIEVKRRAATGAVTQLITYSLVWMEDFPDTVPPNLILIANTVSPTISPVLKRANIRLDLVQADFSILRRLP